MRQTHLGLVAGACTILLLVLPGIAFALTFQPAQGVGVGLDPSIAVDGQNVYVGWRGTQGAVCYPTGCYNDIFFARSADGGASFSTTINVSHDLDQSLFPVVASSGSNVYVAWEDSYYNSYPQVYFSRSTDGGSTFGSAVNLSNDSGYTQNLIVAASGSNVYLVWQDNTPGNLQIFFRQSKDYGADFNPVVNLSNGPAGAPTLSLTTTSIYVAWTYGPGGVNVRRSTDGGTTFGGTYIIPAPAGSRVLFASDSNLYVVWTQQVPRYRDIPAHIQVFFARSTDGGNTFSTATNLSNSPVNSFRPRIGVNGSSIYVAWLDATSSINYSLFLRPSGNGGVTFDQPVKVSDAVYWAFSQDNGWYGQEYLAMHGSNVYLVWYQQVPNSYDVYLGRGS